MKKRKFFTFVPMAILCGVILRTFDCSVSDVSNAIDSNLGTNTTKFASQIDYIKNSIMSIISEKKNETIIEKSVISEIPDDSFMYVHYIDVGQGNATLIICDGEAMLIDCGDNTKGTYLQNYLIKQGVKELKYVIGSHPDADHIGGMDVILTKFDCERVLMPNIEKDTATYRDVILAMDYKGYKNTLPYVGDTYSLGNANFTILAPNKYDYGEEANNYSIGLLLKHGRNSFLFTGDAEKEAESDILNNGLSIKANVLLVGHHGSSSSTSVEFLKEVNPSYAVISCGEGNSYGHPHAETLNQLRASGISIFRTDEQGTIIALSDNNGITWNCTPSDNWQSGR